MRGGERMKKIFYTLMLAPSLLMGSKALAQFGLNDVNTALGERDLKSSINAMINVILGFLGILATVIILLGGFKWMTSQGNSEKVTQAKEMIKNAIIGIAMVLLSYTIVFAVYNIIMTGQTS